MKIQKNIIYDTFRCKTQGKKETMNDILRGTKRILACESRFQNYIHNYSLFTLKNSFKFPDTKDYPVLKTNSSFLVPIKRITNNKSQDEVIKRKIKPNPKLIFSSDFFQNSNSKSEKTSNFRENYTKRFHQFMKLISEPNKKRIFRNRNNEKRFKRYNSLFLDFFDKWNGYTQTHISNNENEKNINNSYESFDNNINILGTKTKKVINTNFPNINIKERYYNLHYDENEIFNANYKNFLEERINHIKINKIKNFQLDIDSSFFDINEKKINLKLKSMKINFYPLTKTENNKADDASDKNLNIYLPLSFVFLFYYKDIKYFQRILMSLIYFEKDFKKINFNDENLYKLLKHIKKDENYGKFEIDKEIDYLANFKKNKKSINLQSNLFLKDMFKSNKKDSLDKEMRKTYNKHNIRTGNRMMSHKGIERHDSLDDNKTIRIFHSNIKLRKMHEKYTESKKNNEKIFEKESDNFYNEYYFMWEIPSKTFKVKIEMPKLYFSYEDLDYNIVTYCERNLFLYLYKNNFINWDFYALNYFFSIKSFRTIILKFFSLNKEFNLIKNSLGNKKKINNLKNMIMINNIDNLLFHDEEDKDKDKVIKNKNIVLKNKKIYNQMNENNESYIFFYSDSYLKNYIIHFYSYHIIIDYPKLNPKYKWEFFLNFKQMRFLIEISKYDSLQSFLPKIIKTNFEFGKLNIDFNVFDEHFNAKILKTKENRTINSIIKRDMNIEVHNPYIEIEKIIIKDGGKQFIRQELNNNMLFNLNKLKVEEWSKKLFVVVDNYFKSDKDEIKENENNMFKYVSYKNNSYLQDFSKIKIKRSSKQKLTYAAQPGFKNERLIVESLKKLKSHET